MQSAQRWTHVAASERRFIRHRESEGSRRIRADVFEHDVIAFITRRSVGARHAAEDRRVRVVSPGVFGSHAIDRRCRTAGELHPFFIGGVEIETDIQRGIEEEFIAPMLLIPFVENAFKHGVSLVHPSHIYIALERTDTSVVFTVINSRHDKQHMDPERHKSGIGLENVKQRLELLYPERHRLVIQENDKEFIAKLVIQLD